MALQPEVGPEDASGEPRVAAEELKHPEGAGRGSAGLEDDEGTGRDKDGGPVWWGGTAGGSSIGGCQISVMQRLGIGAGFLETSGGRVGLFETPRPLLASRRLAASGDQE